MVDLAHFSKERLLIVASLKEGNPDPLATHLAAGGELFGDQREALVKYLRREFPRRPGNQRTFAQHWSELEIRQRVIALQWHFAINEGKRGSLRKALDAYLEQNPKVQPDSLRKYVKKGIPKGTLDCVDEIRAEMLAQLKRQAIPSE
jgi:hypothetical protein